MEPDSVWLAGGYFTREALQQEQPPPRACQMLHRTHRSCPLLHLVGWTDVQGAALPQVTGSLPCKALKINIPQIGPGNKLVTSAARKGEG